MLIKKALLSVSDKTGIIELAQKLITIDVEIISTGGTQKVLQDAGIKTTDISEVTKNPEAFGGRMKTISFQIESALLYDREKDTKEAALLHIEPIDLVVCNLYPFEKVLKEGADFDTLIENIDIGGPTMVRAAAKNFKYVTVLTSPDDYNQFIEELDQNSGGTTLKFRQQLMAKAFNHTADYDALIAQTMDKSLDKHSLRLSFTEGKPLRYGENSHQQAIIYKQKDIQQTFHDMKILHGKAMSYNNILDVSGAVNAISELSDNACAVVKHSNPCGLAQAKDQRQALELAWQGDPVSAFGSIIAFNQKLTLDTVKFFNLDHEKVSERKFIEVVIAPDYDDDALAYLQHHKALRVLVYDAKNLSKQQDLRYVHGTLLSQDYDQELYDRMDCVTSAGYDIDKQKALVEFGLKTIKNIKSNAIVIVGQKNDDFVLMGMGAGQPNRLISSELALSKATDFIKSTYGDSANFEEKLAEAMLISDAFFPFPDNVELAHQKGIKTIVQPGGSIRDKAVINAANELGVNMIFTRLRHFKH